MRISTRHKVLGISVALLLAGLCVAFFSPPSDVPDPVHRGRKASQWIGMLDSQYGAEEAKGALIEMGHGCIPQMAQYLKRSSAPFAASLRYRNFRGFLTHWLKAPQYDPTSQGTRIAIMELTPQLGAHGKDLVPLLVESANDKGTTARHFAIQSLGRMGPTASNAVPSLMRCLDSSDEVTMRVAVLALTRIGGLTQGHITRLKRLIDHPNATISSFSTLAVWKFARTPESVAQVEGLFNHRDEAHRLLMIQVSPTIGADNELVRALLEAKRGDTNETEKVRTAAATALQSLATAP